MSRVIDELLPAASKAFEEQSSPFSTEWLIEHNVSADECFDLSMAISASIDFFLVMAAPKRGKAEVVRRVP